MKAETLRAVLAPFFEQDPAPLYVSICCDRMYVGWIPPVKCRTCTVTPSAVQVTSLDDADRAAAILPAEKDHPVPIPDKYAKPGPK